MENKTLIPITMDLAAELRFKYGPGTARKAIKAHQAAMLKAGKQARREYDKISRQVSKVKRVCSRIGCNAQITKWNLCGECFQAQKMYRNLAKLGLPVRTTKAFRFIFQ